MHVYLEMGTFNQIAGVFLASANFSSDYLHDAKLANASLNNITWDENTKWEGVRGLETARNVPEALKRQLGLE